MNNGTPCAVAIQADVGITCDALVNALKEKNFSIDLNNNNKWWNMLHGAIKKNTETVMVIVLK